MRIFRCQACRSVIFFENSRCLTCGHELGYIPESQTMTAIDPAGEGLWQGQVPQPDGTILYRKCAHYDIDQACNWLIPQTDSSTLCRSCRLTRTLPDLSVPQLRMQWAKLEAAKRRLCYGLTALGLSLEPKSETVPHGVIFDLLSDTPTTHVTTGHDEGLIVINCAEADDVVRERSRIKLGESYRTLLGHFRHEIGHYFWDRLIRETPRLTAFRELFGDDRQDYAQSQARHYKEGPPPNWALRYISAYASMHPWEDWAETWAHYLHCWDTVEIGQQFGISIRSLGSDTLLRPRAPGSGRSSFDDLVEAWIPFTYAVNSLNRGMGLPDWYPFTLCAPAIDKMRFVHETIEAAGRAGHAVVPLSPPPVMAVSTITSTRRSSSQPLTLLHPASPRTTNPDDTQSTSPTS